MQQTTKIIILILPDKKYSHSFTSTAISITASRYSSSFIPSTLAWIHHIDLNSCRVYSAQYITV